MSEDKARPIYAFLGAGRMGEAILAGMLRAGVASPQEIIIVEASAGRSAEIAQRYGVVVEEEVSAAVLAADAVILAVKPQELGHLLEGLSVGICRERLFISIAAGCTLAWLEERLPGARVVRAMPNLAMRVGEGMSAFCLGRLAVEDDRRVVREVLGSSGKVREIAEELFDAVTALSGSGPAFLAAVLKTFVAGAVSLGLPQEDALVLALQTFRGTAGVLAEGDESPDEFIRSVTSAKGTTAAGLEVLQSSGLEDIVRLALAAAAERSRELSRMQD